MVGREKELGSFGGCAGWPTLFWRRSVSCCCIDPIIKSQRRGFAQGFAAEKKSCFIVGRHFRPLDFFCLFLAILDFDLFRVSLTLALLLARQLPIHSPPSKPTENDRCCCCNLVQFGVENSYGPPTLCRPPDGHDLVGPHRRRYRPDEVARSETTTKHQTGRWVDFFVFALFLWLCTTTSGHTQIYYINPSERKASVGAFATLTAIEYSRKLSVSASHATVVKSRPRGVCARSVIRFESIRRDIKKRNHVVQKKPGSTNKVV